MKLISTPENLKPRRFVIEHDEAVGFYIYVYDNDHCTHDYLQDTLEIAINFASKHFQVPKDSWKRIED